MDKILLNRQDVSTKIGDLSILNYFGTTSVNTKEFKQMHDGDSTLRIGDGAEMLTSLKDGLEGYFANNGFALFDLVPNLPLYKFFRLGSVPARFGGGFAEQVNAYRINIGMANARATGTQTNETNLTDYRVEELFVPTYAIQFSIHMGRYEQMKASHINFDILRYKLEGLRLSYQRELEYLSFIGNKGISDIDETSENFVGGLLNQKIGVYAREYEFGKDWTTDATVDIDYLIDAFINIFSKIEVELQHDETKYPNQMHVPNDIYALLSKPAVVGNTPLAISNLEYLMNRIEDLIGNRVVIKKLPYLNKGATANSTTAGIVANGKFNLGMIVISRNDEAVMRTYNTLPLTGGSVYQTKGGFNQDFIGISSPLMVLYPTIFYLHNGGTKNWD